VELLPLELGDLSEELVGVHVDRLLGPSLHPPANCPGLVVDAALSS
jgi:hypothetical protein